MSHASFKYPNCPFCDVPHGAIHNPYCKMAGSAEEKLKAIQMAAELAGGLNYSAEDAISDILYVLKNTKKPKTV